MSNTQNASDNGLQLIPWSNFDLPYGSQRLSYQCHLPKDTQGVLLSSERVATIVKHVSQLETADLRKHGWREGWDTDYSLDVTQEERLNLQEHPCGDWSVELVSEGTEEVVTSLLTYLWFDNPALFCSPTDAAQVAEEAYFHHDSRICFFGNVQPINWMWSPQLFPPGAPFSP
jgi:hypothetical protein